MPEPTLRVRRSARRFPANTLRDTMCRCSRVFRKRSSNSFDRSATRGSAAAPVWRWPSGRLRSSTAIPLRSLAGLLEDLADDGVGLDALGLALEVQDQAV